ncbi:hypothetical protein CRG98_004794 [Punica granatum]|uniref:Integrase catalytic domain-containing protein n=1 Tax=Punica granatum TaxID=22663 RepID=A0A2I0L3R8_PUNGR|nr:hypothetical protein CRG98_004794 [Punica granatum]
MGSSIVRASGVGCVLIPSEGEPLKYALVLTFPATNNEAEYEALITGLLIAKGVGITNLHVKCDSQFVVRITSFANSMKELLEHTREQKPLPQYAKSVGGPLTELTPILVTWPFSTWGIDIMGPLPLAFGGRKFIVMFVEYFSKWVEVDAVASICEKAIIKFFTILISRFVVPYALVSDNGTQFPRKEFEKFCMSCISNKGSHLWDFQRPTVW